MNFKNWDDININSQWAALSNNRGLPWSYDFIKKYENRWEWGCYFKTKHTTFEIGGASLFISKAWTLQQLLEFEEQYDWEYMVDFNPGLYDILFREIQRENRVAFIRFLGN